MNLPIWSHNFFHIFLSIEEKFEVDTTPILNILNGKDKEILISKSDFNSQSMKSFIFNEETLIKKINMVSLNQLTEKNSKKI